MTDPPELCCPISHALMEDPVVAGDGFTYERSCIEGDWVDKMVTMTSEIDQGKRWEKDDDPHCSHLERQKTGWMTNL